MNNAAFGKAIENERKHGHVNLATAKAEKGIIQCQNQTVMKENLF